MTPEETMNGWGRRVVADGQWLLHTSTLVLGPAVEFFDGVGRVYISEANGEPVPGPVVKLGNGHALVANPNAFVEVSHEEVAFYQTASERLGDYAKAAMGYAGSRQVPGKTALTLLIAVLRAQLAALESASARMPT